MYLYLFYFRYESQTKEIIVPNDTGSVIQNFTLFKSNPKRWSSLFDFGISENLASDSFLSNSKLSEAMANLENLNPNVAEFEAGVNEDSMIIHSLKITKEVVMHCTSLFMFIDFFIVLY